MESPRSPSPPRVYYLDAATDGCREMRVRDSCMLSPTSTAAACPRGQLRAEHFHAQCVRLRRQIDVVFEMLYCMSPVTLTSDS